MGSPRCQLSRFLSLNRMEIERLNVRPFIRPVDERGTSVPCKTCHSTWRLGTARRFQAQTVLVASQLQVVYGRRLSARAFALRNGGSVGGPPIASCGAKKGAVRPRWRGNHFNRAPPELGRRGRHHQQRSRLMTNTISLGWQLRCASDQLST